MIRRLLIANRGEIARRIMRTCRALGIDTVAVYSDADAHMPHVREADFAEYLGPSAASDSYLRIDKLIAAAQRSGADAIHPGYGFLSENTRLAAACSEAELIFVGPPAHAIEVMGDKSAARKLMAESGVPVLPGCDHDPRDNQALLKEADKIGYPLLIKAVAGGGGKGMRIVHQSAEFIDALQAARREAKAAFADDQVLLERYLQRARHIEVQVFADQHGHTVHLFERDCSVQRRHQKIIEEAPAPGLTQTQRDAAGNAAVQAAKAIGYVGAGTVEFLFAEGHFYFMEMNTRLQVEHPVTELITGEDLVAWQLQVAAGEPLPKKQAELSIHGAAMEVRIYAEDPWQQFMPSSGLLRHAQWPHALARVDSGYEQGDRVTSYYDPMLAKIICHGDNREQARQQLLRALESTVLDGIHHNIGFLHQTLNSEAFAGAALDTRLLDHNPQLLDAPALPLPLAAVAGALQMLESRQSATPVNDPWQQLSGWRPLAKRESCISVTVAGENFDITIGRESRIDNDAQQSGSADDAVESAGADHADANLTNRLFARIVQQREGERQISEGTLHWRRDGAQLSVSFADQHLRGYCLSEPQRALLNINGNTVLISEQDYQASAQQADHQDGFAAPMSGNVVAVHVTEGESVTAGQAVVTLEAMKMEHTLRASQPGTITAIHTSAGEQVAEGKVLVEFAAESEQAASSPTGNQKTNSQQAITPSESAERP